MHTTRPPAHRNYVRYPVAVGSTLSVSADWNSWPAQLSEASVLPEQFFNPQISFFTKRPVVALLRAVFEDALACFQSQFMTEGPRLQREAQEAEQWFLSEDDHWPFSFVSICAVLGLEPEAIRQQLKRQSHFHPAMPQNKMHRSITRQPHRGSGRLS
jgi:hypothetical protein